jgi:hypothetical protein
VDSGRAEIISTSFQVRCKNNIYLLFCVGVEFRHTLYEQKASRRKVTWGRAQIIKRHYTERHTKVNEWFHTFLTRTQQGHLSVSDQGGFSLRVRDGRTCRADGWVWTHSWAARDDGE